ncbi:MAG TPA: type II secretion system F family protein [Paenalcaligenes sp.]|nr:type II secretion system F family protein [Paenalcaligenes sp.]
MSYFLWAILSGIFFSLFLIGGLFFFGASLKHRIYGLLHANFYFLRDYHIEYWAPITGVAVFLSGYILLNSLVYSGLVLFLFLLFVYALLKQLNFHLHRKIISEIPFFLRLLGAALQSGLSVQSALQETISDWQGPLRKELSLLLRELQVGVSLLNALENFRGRMPVPAVNMMTLALEVSLRSGGTVAPLLEEIAENIQQRIELQNKISALALQGKLQAHVLTIVPYLLLAALYWLDKSWVLPFKESLIGNVVLSLCLLMSVIGFFVIQKMVDIRI